MQVLWTSGERDGSEPISTQSSRARHSIRRGALLYQYQKSGYRHSRGMPSSTAHQKMGTLVYCTATGSRTWDIADMHLNGLSSLERLKVRTGLDYDIAGTVSCRYKLFYSG